MTLLYERVVSKLFPVDSRRTVVCWIGVIENACVVTVVGIANVCDRVCVRAGSSVNVSAWVGTALDAGAI